MPFEKGKSGNPGGMSRDRRRRLDALQRALDKAFKPDENGPDELIDIIVAGVREGKKSCIELACKYRWGDPPKDLDVNVRVSDAKEMSDAELESIARGEEEGAQLQ